MKNLFIIIFCFAYFGETFGQQCTNCSQPPTGTNASAIGTSTVASGHSTFASGHTSVAIGNVATAIGGNVEARADGSIVIGRFLKTSGGQSIVLGSGKTNTIRLENGISNTMMIGFNSNYPTFFVSKTESGFQSGSIGIGNVTAPQAKLHIRGDAVEDATLLLEAQGSQSSLFTLAGQTGNIVFSGGSGNIGVARYRNPLNFYTADQQNNPRLSMTIEGENGFVGIGTSAPTSRLHVAGAVRVAGNLIINDTTAITSGRIGRFANGSASSPAYSFSGNTNTGMFRPTTNTLAFSTGGTERVRIADNGSVGIGTGNPQEMLDVKGNLRTDGIVLNNATANNNFITGQYHPLIYASMSGGNIPGGGSSSLILQAGGGTQSNRHIFLRTADQTRVFIHNNGNVGIGTTNPEKKLVVNGDIEFIGELYKNGDLFSSSNWTVAGNNVYRIDGNVGIGTTSPEALLHVNGSVKINSSLNATQVNVNGTIYAKQIRVRQNVPNSDHVFKQDYNLMPLRDVEQFIREYGHLPEVPSAIEFQENGYLVGDMDDLLLRKVEELTLYIIELNKRFESLELENSTLRSKAN